jgi:aminopeptidase N
VDGVTVRVFGDRPASRRALMKETVGALKIFQRRFGPYGSPEFDVVETRFGFFGMEYAEMVMENPSVGTAAHELAHQWWFGIVGDNQYANPWLDETLASYSDAATYTGFQFCSGFSRLRNPNVRLDKPMSYWVKHRAAYGAIIYGWGACQLRRLEKRVGRPTFNRFLQRLVTDFRYGVLTPADFAHILREEMPARINVMKFLKKTRAVF